MPVKATEQEDEYFARLEFERRKRALGEPGTPEAEAARRDKPPVATGPCPKCGGKLIPVPYKGIELDKCSQCQGVWLDFGELDQVVTEDAGLFGSLRRIFT